MDLMASVSFPTDEEARDAEMEDQYNALPEDDLMEPHKLATHIAGLIEHAPIVWLAQDAEIIVSMLRRRLGETVYGDDAATALDECAVKLVDLIWERA